MRVCLATSALIAAVATHGLCADMLRTVVAENELVIGEVILVEPRRVLTTKCKVPADRVGAIEAHFAPFPVLPNHQRRATCPCAAPAIAGS